MPGRYKSPDTLLPLRFVGHKTTRRHLKRTLSRAMYKTATECSTATVYGLHGKRRRLLHGYYFRVEIISFQQF